jgi:hypothetical protein
MDVALQGKDPRLWPVEDVSIIRHFFASLGKHVIYFAGYGELGYEEVECVQRIAHQVLGEWTPSKVVMHVGTLLRVGGHNGIADIYVVARELGIETTGIHPSVAQDFADTHRVSPFCDHVFFVADETWGGLLEGGENPSQTLRLHLDVSDEIVVIGGGKHAAGELKAFVSSGKPVRFFAADMNHNTTRQWAESANVNIEDMRGAAHLLWTSIGHKDICVNK